MALVSLTLAKKHLRVAHSDEDDTIGAYLAAAEAIVVEYIDRAVYPSAADSPAGAPPSGEPRPLKARRAAQPCNLMAISAKRLPWNFAPSSSCAEGWRDPSLSDIVVMP